MTEQIGTPQLTTTELWEHLFGEQEGYLVTFVGRQSERPNELDDTEQRSWRYPRDREKAAEYLLRHSESGYDAYFGVHLFEKPGNRRKDNAAEKVWALWCDTDGAMLPDGYPEPNIRVESSPGREHLYWLFRRPIPAVDAARICRRIAYGMRADIGKWGLGTVLRAPGTLNYKRAETTEVSARLVSSEPYDPDYLDGALPAAEEVLPKGASPGGRRLRTGKPGASPRHRGVSAGEPPVKLSPADLDAWRGTRTVAADDGGGVDRSRTLHWIACAIARGLRRAGISEAESHRIVADAVEERDAALGYQKYTGRDDRAERYAELADEGLAEAARDVPARNGSDGPPDDGTSANGNGGGNANSGGGGGNGGAKKSPADKLMRYVEAEPHELFLDQFGSPHIQWRGEPVPLNSVFDRHLRTLQYHQKEKQTAGKDAVKQARDTLAALAFESGVEKELHTRAAWHEGALYYQLSVGRVVRADRDGWRFEPKPPVLFRRVRNLKPLPDPNPGGDFEVLSGWVHLSNTRDKRLYVAWLVTALLPDIPRPMLEATGQMGSGKTTASRIAKRLLDPTAPETIKMDPRDILQKASHAHILMLDNQNSLPEAAVDTLCRLVTGEADSKRVLYSDDDDLIYEMKRAIIMNGINNPTDRGDARDRTLPVELTRIEQYRPEAEIWAEFEAEHPKLLGLLFETLSEALRASETVKLARPARLADWSLYAASVYEAMGWGVGKFEEDWARVVRVQNQGTLEGSPVAQAILRFMDSRQDYHGLVTDLHRKLKDVAEEMSIDTNRDKSWPKASNWLWKRIKEVLPLLTALGIRAEKDIRDSRGTCIGLSRCAPNEPGGGGSGGGGSPESAPEGVHGSNHGSKDPLLAQLLPWGDPAEEAENASNGSNASIPGYSAGSLSRTENEEGGDTPENGGVEGLKEPENGEARKVPENACITSITSTDPLLGGSEGGYPDGSVVDEDWVSLTPRERMERVRDEMAAEAGEPDGDHGGAHGDAHGDNPGSPS